MWLAVASEHDIASGAVDPVFWALSDALFQPGRLAVTLGHVGAMMWLLQAGWLGRAPTLRALGRMAFSVYALRAILGSLILYAGGLVGRFALPGLWSIAVLIWALTAAWPAEAVLRGVSRGAWARPVRRRAEAAQ